MRKRMIKYLQSIDTLLNQQAPSNDYDRIRKEHFVQIQFFQHERLIHLIVTCLFAVLAYAVFITLLFSFSIGLLILFIALLVLLIPYIRHYYFLENGVQKMYEQYDRIYELCQKNTGHESLQNKSVD